MAKGRTTKKISSAERMALALAASHPELGQFRVADELCRQGVQISPSGVRAIWKRHQLETLYKRVSATSGRERESHVALNESQQERFARAEQRQRILESAANDKNQDGTKSKSLRQHLMVVAADTFKRNGYKGTTLKEIAEAAGILPSAIYHYFSSKEELFVEVHDEGFREINAALDQALKGVKDPRRRLETACATHLQLLLSASALAGFTGNSLFTLDDGALTQRLIKARKSYEARFKKMIAALDLPPHIDRKIFRLGLLGALNWTQVWYKRAKRTPADIASELIEIFCR